MVPSTILLFVLSYMLRKTSVLLSIIFSNCLIGGCQYSRSVYPLDVSLAVSVFAASKNRSLSFVASCGAEDPTIPGTTLTQASGKSFRFARISDKQLFKSEK